MVLSLAKVELFAFPNRGTQKSENCQKNVPENLIREVGALLETLRADVVQQ